MIYWAGETAIQRINPKLLALRRSYFKKTDYPELFSAIGGTFGQTATTFDLPTLAGTNC